MSPLPKPEELLREESVFLRGGGRSLGGRVAEFDGILDIKRFVDGLGDGVDGRVWQGSRCQTGYWFVCAGVEDAGGGGGVATLWPVRTGLVVHLETGVSA